MKKLPIAEWLLSLERIEGALAETTAGLDAHESAYAAILSGERPAVSIEPAIDLLRKIDDRLSAHDRRMAVAAELAASVEKLLLDREADLGLWQDAFSRWLGRIQQGASDRAGEATSSG